LAVCERSEQEEMEGAGGIKQSNRRKVLQSDLCLAGFWISIRRLLFHDENSRLDTLEIL